MKIGLYTDSLPDLGFEAVLDWAAEQGLDAVEIGTGNFSSAPHCNLTELAANSDARARFKAAFAERRLTLSALNCNGNLLDPHPERGKNAQAVFFKTVQVASQLGLDTVVTMSGCPGDLSVSAYPNWVTHNWQPEFYELYERQWTEAVEPFWKQAGQFAADHGVRIAIEMHPGQVVYNTRTLLRLREIAGQAVGANFDPSHLFYQGMDPLAVIRALGKGVIFHAHAKDTRLDPFRMAVNGGFDPYPMTELDQRTWVYRALGYGHDRKWWCDFVSELRLVGYDGVVSIEHEDLLMNPREGIIKSIQFLRDVTWGT
ncbi:MAG: sugar phosphate isomerase/epimerase [Anaerolineae bacterium]|nr:sugar phosphate isomerase/epimerase [Anaerolineae bacterium]